MFKSASGGSGTLKQLVGFHSRSKHAFHHASRLFHVILCENECDFYMIMFTPGLASVFGDLGGNYKYSPKWRFDRQKLYSTCVLNNHDRKDL